MSNIKEIPVSNKEKWNYLVKGIEGYDAFYLNEYVDAFMHENSSNGEPVLLYYRNGDECAINVVFKRDIATDPHFISKLPIKTYFDLITPYGYGGFIGNIKDYQALNNSYNEYCRKKKYICEFVRFELFSDYYLNYSGKCESRTHNVVRNLEKSLDEIWMDFKQKVRKNVKRANLYGLKIIIDKNGEYLDDFLRIYYGTMTRSNAESQFYFKKIFFEKLMTMYDNAIMFHALYKNTIISTELVLYGEDNCYSYLGGTDNNYFHTRANDFLKYEIIKWAKDKGLKNFVLGGGYGSDDGIFQYKLNLSPHGVSDFYIGYQIFDQIMYDKLVDLRTDLPDTNFFPLYRS